MTLKPRQLRALDALMASPTIAAASHLCAVSERTLRRWLQEPGFAAAYRAARLELHEQTSARLQGVAADAVDVLHGIATDAGEPAATRVSAARAILSFATRDAADLEAEQADKGEAEPQTWADVVKAAYWEDKRRREAEQAARIPGGG